MMRRLLFILPLLFLAACGREPDAAQVERDVQERLNGAFPNDVMSLASFDRQGRVSTPDGIIVYFKADLRVEQTLDLGQWGAPNAQLLAGVMGAGTGGIAGLTTGGNKPGDRLTVFGTLPYQESGGAWVPAAAQGPVDARVEGPPGVLTGAEKLIAVLNDTLRAAPSSTSPTGARVIEEELESAKRNIDARLARLSAGYPVAAGPPGGAYARVANALASDAQARGIKFAVLPTAGSVENIVLLRQRTAEIAFAQADVAALAAAGKDVFAAAGPYDGLRALLALFPEQLHVIVRADDRARTLDDLSGRRAALGLAGSGTRVTAGALLKAAGVSVEEPEGMDRLDPLAALRALAVEEVDVVFLVGAAPFPPIAQAFGATPLRLLEIDQELADEAKESGVMPLPIPASAYAGQKEAVPTVAVAALLLVDANLTEAEARRLGEGVLNRVGARERDPLALMVAPGTAGLGIAVPLHPGAATLPGIQPR